MITLRPSLLSSLLDPEALSAERKFWVMQGFGQKVGEHILSGDVDRFDGGGIHFLTNPVVDDVKMVGSGLIQWILGQG